MSMSRIHKEMDKNAIQLLPFDGKIYKSTTFINSYGTEDVFRSLQYSRENELFCDIKIETEDGKIIYGHKVILASSSPYFLAMFTNFNEKDKDHIYIKNLDSTLLELLINYIYTRQITVNEYNVLDLLAAANFLQIDYVKDMCTEFLERLLLDPSNCIGIKQFADLHDCTELLKYSEAYIKSHFLKVVKHDEFLSLPPGELIEIISSNDLTAPLEQNVFESVMNWVQHDLNSRKQYLKQLMAHVRLPLTSREYLINNVVGHPLIKISPECTEFVNDALNFNLLKMQRRIVVPNTNRYTRRWPPNEQKIILMVSWASNNSYMNWYDPAGNQWNIAFKTGLTHQPGRITLIQQQFLTSMQHFSATSHILDLFSPEPGWIPISRMIVNQRDFGVGVIKYCVYIVGGFDGNAGVIINTTQVFDINVQEWRMAPSMFEKRSLPGVGVLNNLLYAVGGGSNSSIRPTYLKSVEYYDPNIDRWTLIADISRGRSHVSTGVLDGAIYAIGGFNELGYSKSVEAYRPSDGFWTHIPDLHLERISPEVVTLHGLMYVMGGRPYLTYDDSIEVYNPKTNTWTLMESCLKCTGKLNGAVAINRPLDF